MCWSPTSPTRTGRRPGCATPGGAAAPGAAAAGRRVAPSGTGSSSAPCWRPSGGTARLLDSLGVLN
eukprot:3738427-Pyramimonas_sp.AAC.1